MNCTLFRLQKKALSQDAVIVALLPMSPAQALALAWHLLGIETKHRSEGGLEPSQGGPFSRLGH